nr:MAG TPA: hypothetical protein [Caudoviricetes sp.]
MIASLNSFVSAVNIIFASFCFAAINCSFVLSDMRAIAHMRFRLPIFH